MRKTVLDKLANPESISISQIEAIKTQAKELWGEKWLPQIVREYAIVTGEDERKKFSQVQKWFLGSHIPNLKNMNALMLAVNCKFQMVCYAQPLVKEF